MSQENRNSNKADVTKAGEKLFAQAKNLTQPEVKVENRSVGTYDKKPRYRPKPLALMIRIAIIQMRGNV